jgi:hypothetical protein
MSATRDTIQPFQALQQLANSVSMPFAAPAVGTCRLFNSRAMALTETKPTFRSLRIVAARASARASAARLSASLLLVLPLPNVTRPERVSILTTVVKCHLPPWGAGIPFRFNSSANARCDTKPFAFSSRTVVARARARESAALLPGAAPRIPRLRDEAPPVTCFIRPSWPDRDVLS